MLAQRAVGARLTAAGFSYYNDLRDMKDAFACTNDESRMKVTWAIVPAAHVKVFEQRVKGTVVDLEAFGGGLVQVIPQDGNVIGGSEGPILVLSAYSITCKGWVEESRRSEDLGPCISLVSLADGSEVEWREHSVDSLMTPLSRG